LTAQFGTWSVNEANKTYTTHIDGALFPNVEGTEGKAAVSVSEDELKIGDTNGQAVYRRIKK
jgi:Lipocalin-like domain